MILMDEIEDDKWKKKIFGSTYYVISIFARDMVLSKFF